MIVIAVELERALLPDGPLSFFSFYHAVSFTRDGMMLSNDLHQIFTEHLFVRNCNVMGNKRIK
jgi:hypothetical protein